MHVYKIRAVARFCKSEGIADALLVEAIERAERGLVDVDLGGGLIKQRVARPGQGRSGGWRTLVAYRRHERAIFLFGFAKSDLDNIGPAQLVDLKLAAEDILGLSPVSWRRASPPGIYWRSTMTKRKTDPNRRIDDVLLELAKDGLVRKRTAEKITMRVLGEASTLPADISAADIKAMRKKANVSQAVFAQLLNVTTGYVSQLERGAKRPKGPALALLSVIKRKGLQALL